MTSSYESDLNIEDVIKNIKVDDMDYIFESSQEIKRDYPKPLWDTLSRYLKK